MIAIEAATADEAWRNAARLLQDTTDIQPGRDQPTRELLHVAFTLSDPRQRLVFARPFNPAHAIAEVIWILSGGNACDFVAFWNPRMRRFVDEAGPRVFHGAYGRRLGGRPQLSPAAANALRVTTCTDLSTNDQLRAACDALLHAPDSRQVVLQIWDSTRDLPNPTPRSRDVPCNLLSHIMIRNGQLEWLQIMRSNDLIWGTPLNFIQFTCLQEIMAGWLGVEAGKYVHVSDSLHVYQRHWSELDALALELVQASNLPTNHTDIRILGYREWEEVWERVADIAVRLTARIDPEVALAIINEADNLPTGYTEWIALLTAESLRRQGHADTAVELIDRAGAFWATSWRAWFESKQGKLIL